MSSRGSYTSDFQTEGIGKWDSGRPAQYQRLQIQARPSHSRLGTVSFREKGGGGLAHKDSQGTPAPTPPPQPVHAQGT